MNAATGNPGTSELSVNSPCQLYPDLEIITDYTTGMSPIPNTSRKSDFGSFTHTLTCVGPGMQERTLSIFSEVTSTSSTATSASPEKNMQKVYIYQVNWLNQDKSSKF